jgi:nucleoside 2-deoxyribosyltransferase
MADVYLAAPLFNIAERRFNQALAHRIELEGLTVFLPQRDGLEFARLAGQAESKRNRRIFELDIAAVESAKVLVAILDGRVPDEGVCVELGTAAEHRKRSRGDTLIVGLKTDERAWARDGEMNPMVAGTLDRVFATEDELLAFLKKVRPESKRRAGRKNFKRKNVRT